MNYSTTMVMKKASSHVEATDISDALVWAKLWQNRIHETHPFPLPTIAYLIRLDTCRVCENNKQTMPLF